MCPARRAHSSKPAAAGLLLWDRQTDGQTLYRCIEPVVHAMRAVLANVPTKHIALHCIALHCIALVLIKRQLQY